MAYSNDYPLIRSGELMIGPCGRKTKEEILNSVAKMASWRCRNAMANFPVNVKLSGKNEEGQEVIVSRVVSVEKIDTRPIPLRTMMELYEKDGMIDAMHRMTCPGFLFRREDGTGYLVPLIPGNVGDWSERMQNLIAKSAY